MKTTLKIVLIFGVKLQSYLDLFFPYTIYYPLSIYVHFNILNLEAINKHLNFAMIILIKCKQSRELEQRQIDNDNVLQFIYTHGLKTHN